MRCVWILYQQWTNSLNNLVKILVRYVYYIMLLNRLSRSRRIARLKNDCTIQHESFSLVDDHIWCIESLERNEALYWIIISLIEVFCASYNFSLKITRRIHNFLFDLKLTRTRDTCFSFVEVFRKIYNFFLMKIIRRIHNLSVDWTSAFLLQSHRNDLKNHYDRDFRIWQTRIDRVVCRDRCTYAVSLSVTPFYIESSVVFAEISMYCDQSFLWICHIAEIILTRNKIYCFVLNVDLHANDLVESNCCRINALRSALRRHLKAWLFWHLLYSLSEVLFIL